MPTKRKRAGAQSATHEFHALWWHLGPYGRQDVHLHSCITHEQCGVELVGQGRDCKGQAGGQRHVRKRLTISANGWQNKHMEGTSLYDGKPLGGDHHDAKPKPAPIEEAVALLEDGLFLRMNGERPPGAPHNRPEAETWREWDRQTEDFLRRYRGHGGDTTHAD